MQLDLTKFTEFLYEERVRQGLNQNQLAQKSGVDHTMISRYENFKNFKNCKISTMVKLLNGLGYSSVVELKEEK